MAVMTPCLLFRFNERLRQLIALRSLRTQKMVLLFPSEESSHRLQPHAYDLHALVMTPVIQIRLTISR